MDRCNPAVLIFLSLSLSFLVGVGDSGVRLWGWGCCLFYSIRAICCPWGLGCLLLLDLVDEFQLAAEGGAGFLLYL